MLKNDKFIWNLTLVSFLPKFSVFAPVSLLTQPLLQAWWSFDRPFKRLF